MTHRVIPIFMGLLNLVASRTKPIDFTDAVVAKLSRGDHRDEMFFRGQEIDVNPGDFLVMKSSSRSHRNINSDDEQIQPREWNEQESKFEPDSSMKKIVILDDGTIEGLEDGSRSMGEMSDDDLSDLTSSLVKLLQQPKWKAPLVIFGDPTFSEVPEKLDSEIFPQYKIGSRETRTRRSHRRFSWERQNRDSYDYQYEINRYCKPSRADVVKLLVALHNLRQGNGSQSISFCDRATAGNVFTNIRFLGRRK